MVSRRNDSCLIKLLVGLELLVLLGHLVANQRDPFQSDDITTAFLDVLNIIRVLIIFVRNDLMVTRTVLQLKSLRFQRHHLVLLQNLLLLLSHPTRLPQQSLVLHLLILLQIALRADN